MKKSIAFLFGFGFLLYTALGLGQEWHTANQFTVTWDAVTEMQGGYAIPETDIIEYRLYLSNAITDLDKTNPAEIDVTGDTSYVITLVNEGQYFVGLQTIRKLANGDVIGESIIGWTDDPAIVLDGVTFGIRHFLPPMVPVGVRPGILSTAH